MLAVSSLSAESFHFFSIYTFLRTFQQPNPLCCNRSTTNQLSQQNTRLFLSLPELKCECGEVQVEKCVLFVCKCAEVCELRMRYRDLFEGMFKTLRAFALRALNLFLS